MVQRILGVCSFWNLPTTYSICGVHEQGRLSQGNRLNHAVHGFRVSLSRDETIFYTPKYSQPAKETEFTRAERQIMESGRSPLHYVANQSRACNCNIMGGPMVGSQRRCGARAWETYSFASPAKLLRLRSATAQGHCHRHHARHIGNGC